MSVDRYLSVASGMRGLQLQQLLNREACLQYALVVSVSSDNLQADRQASLRETARITRRRLLAMGRRAVESHMART
jgi:hypothetical protein